MAEAQQEEVAVAHPFIPSKDKSKIPRQLGHVATYYKKKGEPAKAAEFSRGAVGRRLQARNQKGK